MEDHDDGVTMVMIMCSGLEKKKEKRKDELKVKVYLIEPFCFGDQDMQ